MGLGWAGQRGLELVSIGMVLGEQRDWCQRAAWWHLGVLTLPGLVELHLPGTSEAPFCTSIPVPTSSNVASVFIKPWKSTD